MNNMKDFQTQDKLQKIAPTNKNLEDVKKLGIKNYETLDSLAAEFLISRLQVTTILKDAEVWPVGGVFNVNPETGKRGLGRPKLAFDGQTAKDTISRAVKEMAQST